MIGSVNAGSTAVRSFGIPKTPVEGKTENRQTEVPIQNKGRTKEQARADFMAKYSLSPKEALASNAELGPATDMGAADNHISKLHTEIKVNGKVIARVYNGGGVEIVNEYGFLVADLGSNEDGLTGPDLAADRVKHLRDALEGYGAVLGDEQGAADGSLSGIASQRATLEVLQASTAQTQEEWWREEGQRGRIELGSVFSDAF